MRPCATTLASELEKDELDCLLGLLRTSNLKGKHLEIGTAAGGTLWQLIDSYDEPHCPLFVAVDPMKYFPNQLETVHENLSKNGISPEKVDFRVTTSDLAFTHAKRNGETFDFIFVDGAHKVRYVMEDLRWATLLNAGGLLVLHDFAPQYRGVWYAVNRFLRKNSHFSIVGQANKLIALRKEYEISCPEVSYWDLLVAKVLAPYFQIESSFRKHVRL